MPAYPAGIHVSGNLLGEITLQGVSSGAAPLKAGDADALRDMWLDDAHLVEETHLPFVQVTCQTAAVMESGSYKIDYSRVLQAAGIVHLLDPVGRGERI